MADVGRWQENITIWAKLELKTRWGARIRQHNAEEDPEAEEPDLPVEEEDAWLRSLARSRYSELFKQYQNDKKLIKQEGEKLFAKMQQNLSEAAQARLSQKHGEAMWTLTNPGTLMDRVRETFTGLTNIGRTTAITIAQLRKAFTNIKQYSNETVLEYARRFKGQLDGLKMAEENLGITKQEAEGRYGKAPIVIQFLMSLNRTRYGQEQLKIEFNQSDPAFAQMNPMPGNLDQAVNRACTWEQQYTRTRDLMQENSRNAIPINAFKASTQQYNAGKDGSRPKSEPVYDTHGRAICFQHLSRGGCKYGNKCKYSHEPEAKKAQPAIADDVKRAVGEVRGAHAGGGPAPKGV